jgi:hypothetical protein
MFGVARPGPGRDGVGDVGEDDGTRCARWMAACSVGVEKVTSISEPSVIAASMRPFTVAMSPLAFRTRAR